MNQNIAHSHVFDPAEDRDLIRIAPDEGFLVAGDDYISIADDDRSICFNPVTYIDFKNQRAIL